VADEDDEEDEEDEEGEEEASWGTSFAIAEVLSAIPLSTFSSPTTVLPSTLGNMHLNSSSHQSSSTS